MTNIKYPEIKIQLSGEDGNAFFIIGKCISAMRRACVPEEECRTFLKEANSSDYNHLLSTCMKWFDVM